MTIYWHGYRKQLPVIYWRLGNPFGSLNPASFLGVVWGNVFSRKG